MNIRSIIPSRKGRGDWSRGFMSLAESLTDPVCLWRSDGRVILSNAAMDSLLHRGESGHTGRTPASFIASVIDDVLKKPPGRDDPLFTETILTDVSGNTRRFRWKSIPAGGRGPDRRFLSTGTDVTCHLTRNCPAGTDMNTVAMDNVKRIGEPANRNVCDLSRYRTILEFIPIGITVMNRKGRILDMNRASCRFLGGDAGDSGKMLSMIKEWDLIRPDSSVMSPGEDPLSKALQMKGDVDMVMGIRRPDRPLSWISVTATPLPQEDDSVIIAYQDITDRKKAGDMLVESEQRYRELFGAMSTGVCVCLPVENGDDFIIRDLNQAARRITEMETGEVTGHRITEMFPGAKESGILDIIRRVWQTGAAEHRRPVFYRDGRIEGWIKVNAYRLSSGEVVILFDDITERVNAHQKIEEGERLLSFTLEQIPVPLVIAAADGSMLHINPAARRISETDREDRSCISLDDFLSAAPFFSPEGIPLSREEIPVVRSLEKGERITMDLMIHAKGKSPAWVSASSAPLSGDDGAVTAAIMVFPDISETRELLRSVRSSEEHMRFVIRNMPVMMVALDENGRFLIWNRECEKVLGYSEEEILSAEKPMMILCPGMDYRRNMMSEWSARGNRFQNWEWLITCKDGTVKSTTWSSNLADNPIPGWATWCMGVDTTQLRKAEADKERLNRELEQRVESRTRELEYANRELEAFTYSVSHDLRAPLRHILSFTDLILEKYGDSLDNGLRRYVDIISDSAENMSVLIEALLDFSRMGRSEIRTIDIDLGFLVNRVLMTFEDEVRNRRIRVTVSPLPAVAGDPALLQLVFTNLLSNAIKFTRGRKDPAVSIESALCDEGRTICVRDNGAGFDMRYSNRLFGVFQRLHREEEFEGTGIGLATVSRIIHRHGWRIRAEGRPGEGAAFTLIIPPGIPGDGAGTLHEPEV